MNSFAQLVKGSKGAIANLIAWLLDRLGGRRSTSPKSSLKRLHFQVEAHRLDLHTRQQTCGRFHEYSSRLPKHFTLRADSSLLERIKYQIIEVAVIGVAVLA